MAPEVLEPRAQEDEERFEDMTMAEKEEWATGFLRERGYSVSGGEKGEGRDDAMKKAWRGGSPKPGSHHSRRHR